MLSIAEEIWNLKYRLRDEDGSAIDNSVADTFSRAATAAASAESGGKCVRQRWAKKFHEAMSDFGFLPGGRILAGAGSGRRVTLFNCFVMGLIKDDMESIFEALKEGALTMQAGGGAGYAAVPVLHASGDGVGLGDGCGQSDGEDDDGFHGFSFLVESAAAR